MKSQREKEREKKKRNGDREKNELEREQNKMEGSIYNWRLKIWFVGLLTKGKREKKSEGGRRN